MSAAATGAAALPGLLPSAGLLVVAAVRPDAATGAAALPRLFPSVGLLAVAAVRPGAAGNRRCQWELEMGWVAESLGHSQQEQ